MNYSPMMKYLCQKCWHEVTIRYGFNTCPDCKTEGYLTGSYTRDQIRMKTFTEVEREIRDLKALINFIRSTLSTKPGDFLFCKAWLDEVPRAIDFCENRIRELLAA